MISTCNEVAGQRHPCKSPSLEDTVESVVPVTYQDASDGRYLNYINRQCAMCNHIPNDTRLIEWDFEIKCDSILSITDKNLLATIGEKGCNMFFVPPGYYQYFLETCDIPSYQIAQCNETGLWKNYNETIDQGCKAFVDPFNQTYKNYYCYLCNVDNALPHDEWYCEDPFEAQLGPNPFFDIRLSLDLMEQAKKDELLTCDDLTKQFQDMKSVSYGNTEKHVISVHSKIDKTKVLKTDNRLMQVKSIAECSKRAFCNTFDLH